MFTQDIVDFLNQGGGSRGKTLLESNLAVYNFVTCPYVVISPLLFDEAQRVSVVDNHFGRFVTILKRDGERCYIFQVLNDAVTIAEIEELVHSIEGKGGVCSLERSFLIIDLPLGYLLDMHDACLARIVVQQDKFEDIGLE